jgi:hypothetical protein
MLDCFFLALGRVMGLRACVEGERTHLPSRGTRLQCCQNKPEPCGGGGGRLVQLLPNLLGKFYSSSKVPGSCDHLNGFCFH